MAPGDEPPSSGTTTRSGGDDDGSPLVTRRRALGALGLGVGAVGVGGGLAAVALTGDDEPAAGGGPADAPASGRTTTTTSRPTSVGATERTIKLGTLIGVSEALGDLGPPIRRAAELAAEYVDRESGFTVDYRFEDTAVQVEQGAEAAQRLVKAGYPAMVGALSSAVTLGVAKGIAIPEETVLCSPSSGAPEIGDLDDDGYVYRTVPSDGFQGRAMARFGQEGIGADSTAVLAVDATYGRTIADAYVEEWKSRGGTVQKRVHFGAGTSDHSELLKNVLADEPDLLAVVGFLRDAVVIFKQFYNIYSQEFCDIVIPSALQRSDLPADVGNSMRNVWGTAPTERPFTAQAFDAAAVLLLANAAAGENDGAAVRDQVRAVANPGGQEVLVADLDHGIRTAAEGEAVNYQGASGPVTFDDAGDIATAVYDAFRYGEEGYDVVDQVEVESG